MACETGIGCGNSGLLHDLGGMLANFLDSFGNPAFSFLFTIMMIAFIVFAIIMAKRAIT